MRIWKQGERRSSKLKGEIVEVVENVEAVEGDLFRRQKADDRGQRGGVGGWRSGASAGSGLEVGGKGKIISDFARPLRLSELLNELNEGGLLN